MDAVLHDPTFWVAVAFVGFLAILWHFKLHWKIGAALDARSDRIKTQIDEARALKEDAQALLAQFKRRQNDAAKDVAAIISLAKEEAALFAEEARVQFEEAAARRTRIAEEKIVQAHTNAVKDVQAVAAEIAVRAARQVITDHIAKEGDAALVEKTIASLDKRLH